MGAGMLPERETQIDSGNPAIADLAARMFAGPIAEGEVVVTDPEPVAQVPAPAAPEVIMAQEQEAERQGDRMVAAAVQTVTAPTPEDVPTFKPKLDDDLRALLDEPDFEAEAAAEVQAELDDPDGEYEYTDPQAKAAQRAAEKRIAFLESQLVAKSKKGWVEEAKRTFPDLARLIPGEIEAITASSRRTFMQAANAANTKYATVLGPTLEKLEAERRAISGNAVAVAREEVANAWGRPAADTLPPLAAAQQDALEKTRKAGDLDAGIKVLMQEHPVL